MPVTDSINYRNFLAGLDNLNSQMGIANQEVSTGKKLLSLKDSPSGSAEVVNLLSQISELDQYQSNNNSVTYSLNLADSALNSLNNLVTSIYTTGSGVASSTTSAQDRATAAAEIRSMRDQVLALANTESNNDYIFGGSESTTAPFTISGDTVTLNGNPSWRTTVNSVSVADGVQVQQNVPGATVFQSVFTTISSLLTALDNNDSAGVQSALGNFSSTLSSIGQVRAQVDSNLSQLSNLQSQLASNITSLTSRQSQIQDANQAEVATQLSQTQTAIEAALSAQNYVTQYNLFDFLA